MPDDTDNVVRLDIPSYAHPGTIKGDNPPAGIARAALSDHYEIASNLQDAGAAVKDKGRLAQVAIKVAERAVREALNNPRMMA